MPGAQSVLSPGLHPEICGRPSVRVSPLQAIITIALVYLSSPPYLTSIEGRFRRPLGRERGAGVCPVRESASKRLALSLPGPMFHLPGTRWRGWAVYVALEMQFRRCFWSFKASNGCLGRYTAPFLPCFKTHSFQTELQCLPILNQLVTRKGCLLPGKTDLGVYHNLITS